MESKDIIIVEWNLNERKVNSVPDKEKIKQIVEQLEELKADMVVLTEVKSTYRIIMEALSERYFAMGSNNGGNANNIVIGVSSEKIDRVLFEDYYIYPTRKNFPGRECEKRIHPDRLLAKIKLKDSDRWLSILGIRMQIANTSYFDKKDQVEALKWELENAKPDLVIGDFNWYTAIQSDGFDDGFKNYIKEKKYTMFPSQDDGSFSFIYTDKAKKKHYTSPDRVLYKNYKCDPQYGCNTRKTGEEFEFLPNWPSDHDILKVTVTIPDEK